MGHLPVEAQSSGGARSQAGTRLTISGGPVSPESFGRLVHMLRAEIARKDALWGLSCFEPIVLPVTAERQSSSEET